MTKSLEGGNHPDHAPGDPGAWELVHVLPNLRSGEGGTRVDPEFGLRDGAHAQDDPGDHPGPWLAIVPANDERVVEIRGRHPRFDGVLNSFKAFHEREPYEPAVLIVRADAPGSVNGEAVVAFRNVFALCVIFLQRAAEVARLEHHGVLFSDHFHFHPVTFKPDQTPDLELKGSGYETIGWRTNERCNLWTHSPDVRLCDLEGCDLRDGLMYAALAEEWRRLFVKSCKTQFNLSLFRSLEVAYLASTTPKGNEKSIHDFGAQIFLWVSALEILAWPRKKHADKEAVLCLLGRAPLRRELRKSDWKCGKLKANALEYVCCKLYHARNKFAHGNPVDRDSLFLKDVSLPKLASLVYRAALVAYLSQKHPADGPSSREVAQLAEMAEVFGVSTYDEALARAVGVDLESEPA